jgi:D-alanyl-D-alanine carboxypeptidase
MFDSSSNKPYDAGMKTQKRKRLNKRRALHILVISTVLVAIGVLVLTVREQRATAPPYDAPLTVEAAREEPVEQRDTPESTPATQIPFDKTKYSTGDAASQWVVVNKQNPLIPSSYAPTDLVGIGNGQLARANAASALGQLLTAATDAGQPVSVLSGYRSYATQSSLYNNYVRTDGQANADTYSARPGHSEHQTGLAVDIGNGVCNLLACFGDTSAGKWLAANAHSYGFIIRYPAGKTAVTGYQYEPWHLRYVGVELATEMQRKNIQTLEEFFGIPGGTRY